MNDVAAIAEQRVFLREVSWKTFQALHQEVGPARGRLAYDRGLLEIMSPSYEHDVVSRLLALLVHALTDELSLPMLTAGSTKLERSDRRVAVQPDECFFVGGAMARRGRPELDLTRDLPPDLVVEVDISRSSRARMKIYGVIGIPEVWRWNGDEVEILLRRERGAYTVAGASGLFPRVSAPDLTAFVRRHHEDDHNAIVRAFRSWVRERHSRAP
jgi:Uma2 family endonuclease